MGRAVLVVVMSCVLLATAPPPTALAGNAEFGRTWAKDKTLRSGCHDYRYQYRVKPTESDWALETFLIDPRKKEIAAGQMLFNADPERGSSIFRLCRRSIVPGKYKIKGKLTYNGDGTSVWIEPGFFRLRKVS